MNLSKLMALLLVLTLLLVACGGDNGGADNNDTSGGGDNTASGADEEPTPFPTFEFVAPTNPPVFNQNAESTDEAEDTETVELDPKMIERGRGRYEALECGICHGENGEGTDEVGGLIEMALTEDEFTTFMRSGGDIGSSHQYSTDRLSRNGTRNLYQYILSLSQDA